MWTPVTILSSSVVGYPHQHFKVLPASRINSQGKQACSFESLGVCYESVVNNTTHVNHGSGVIFYCSTSFYMPCIAIREGMRVIKLKLFS
jgi:hypothetical protein